MVPAARVGGFAIDGSELDHVLSGIQGNAFPREHPESVGLGDACGFPVDEEFGGVREVSIVAKLSAIAHSDDFRLGLDRKDGEEVRSLVFTRHLS